LQKAQANERKVLKWLIINKALKQKMSWGSKILWVRWLFEMFPGTWRMCITLYNS
jgi:hypothetical protein